LTVAPQIPAIPTRKNFTIAQVKTLWDFAKALGTLFSLAVAVAIIFAGDGLAFAGNAYWMALLSKAEISENQRTYSNDNSNKEMTVSMAVAKIV